MDNIKELERSSESEKTALWAEAKKQINQALAEGYRGGIAQAQERYNGTLKQKSVNCH